MTLCDTGSSRQLLNYGAPGIKVSFPTGGFNFFKHSLFHGAYKAVLLAVGNLETADKWRGNWKSSTVDGSETTTESTTCCVLFQRACEHLPSAVTSSACVALNITPCSLSFMKNSWETVYIDCIIFHCFIVLYLFEDISLPMALVVILRFHYYK